MTFNLNQYSKKVSVESVEVEDDDSVIEIEEEIPSLEDLPTSVLFDEEKENNINQIYQTYNTYSNLESDGYENTADPIKQIIELRNVDDPLVVGMLTDSHSKYNQCALDRLKQTLSALDAPVINEITDRFKTVVSSRLPFVDGIDPNLFEELDLLNAAIQVRASGLVRSNGEILDPITTPIDELVGVLADEGLEVPKLNEVVSVVNDVLGMGGSNIKDIMSFLKNFYLETQTNIETLKGYNDLVSNSEVNDHSIKKILDSRLKTDGIISGIDKAYKVFNRQFLDNVREVFTVSL